MEGIKIEKFGSNIYIKCKKCDTILLTNDQSYSLRQIKRDELYVISACDHFQNISIYKDPQSLKKLNEIKEMAILEYEGKYYITFLIPRSS